MLVFGSQGNSDSPIHTKLHLLLVVRYWLVDILEHHPQLRIDVPTQRATQHTAAKVVKPVFRIPEHDRKVLRHISQQDVQRMHAFDDGLGSKDAIMKHVGLRVLAERKVLRVAGAHELKHHLHKLLAGELRPWKIVEDQLAVVFEKRHALLDARFVRLLKLKPPVCFEFGESCEGGQPSSINAYLESEQAGKVKIGTYTLFGDTPIEKVGRDEATPFQSQIPRRVPGEVHR